MNVNKAGQWRGFEYDGYGRLSAQDTPEQGHTAYSYHADDTMQTVTDARGATTTFSYNNRRLVTGITYGVPAGVAQTPTVTYSYDAAGNRMGMTDGMGSVSYSYDQLSQLTSETRTFNGVGAYTLSYQYNLAGEVTRVTNPWGAQVGYTHDRDGRTTQVTGANYVGVSSYASNLQYRAFDGLKALTYGNSHPEWGQPGTRTLALGYDSRQRLTEWHASYVMGWSYSYNGFGENTGRVTFARSSTDATLNRSYDYDQVGRLWEAHTGNEADAHVAGQPFPSQPNGAYSHSYRYDVWGNMTTRVGWGGFNGNYLNWTQTYTNNRRDGWQYDAAGNLVNDGGQQFQYDASLPLTTGEYLEWGNPNEQAAYDYIKSYSPYDNIAAQAYPAMLVKVSLHDSQVPYWEGTKFVARLRAMKTDTHPLLLKVNLGAGHGGASGRYDALHDLAFDYAFILSQLGLTN